LNRRTARNSCKPWTADEERYLTQLNAELVDLPDIAEFLGRTVYACRTRMTDLGIYKSVDRRYLPRPKGVPDHQTVYVSKYAHRDLKPMALVYTKGSVRDLIRKLMEQAPKRPELVAELLEG
jgi:hypothetical protein